MRRLLDLRIVKWETKTAYIAIAWIVGFAIASTIRPVAPAAVVAVVTLLVDVAAFAFAVRIFRGRDEPVEPPRAWWRMTAWPTLSLRLGLLFAVLTLATLVGLGLVVSGAGGASGGQDVPTVVGLCVEYGAAAFLYLNSAVRMKRLGITKPERLPRPMTVKF